MKNIVMILMTVMIGALTIGIIISMMGRGVRVVELQSNLSNIVENVLYDAVASEKYTAADTDRFLADMTLEIAHNLDTNSAVQIDVMKADLEKGLLTLRVTETFDYLNGKKGSVACDRTVIFEKKATDENAEYEIAYYTNEGDTIPYKKYQLLKGDALRIPKNPSKNGYIFNGWKDVDGNSQVAGMKVTGAKIYYAQWTFVP